MLLSKYRSVLLQWLHQALKLTPVHPVQWGDLQRGD
jgi:hypothetical protein